MELLREKSFKGKAQIFQSEKKIKHVKKSACPQQKSYVASVLIVCYPKPCSLGHPSPSHPALTFTTLEHLVLPILI